MAFLAFCVLSVVVSAGVIDVKRRIQLALS